MARSEKISTGKVRLSYAQIWEPRENMNGDLQYSCALLIPKEDRKTLDKINNSIKSMLADPEVVTKLGGKGKLRGLAMPYHDGDEEKPDKPEYAGMLYINAKAAPENPPRIVDLNKNDIIDKGEVYSGCYVQAVINLYPYNNSGNRGFGAGLRGLRKLADGEPFTDSAASDDDFDDDVIGDLPTGSAPQSAAVDDDEIPFL